MQPEDLLILSQSYLVKLCEEIPGRCVGSEGNRLSTQFFEKEVSSVGWDTEVDEFEAIDWMDGGASLNINGSDFEVSVSPYSLGCEAEAELIEVSSLDALKMSDINGKIVLLHGEIAKEQLMPKNFVFYNPDEHQQIVSFLEKGEPEAIICATGRNAALAGGVYPFPLIEDGDFDIPSVYMTEIEGSKLLPFVGHKVELKSISDRIPGKGFNVIGRIGNPSGKRIVVTAHIDSKKGSPGAIDNASGVAVLLLLASLLRNYNGNKQIELVALNGEDYYAVPGQMLYIKRNQDKFHEILLNINIDGAGYKEGESAFSFYGLPKEIETAVRDELGKFKDITEGVQWVQGDHSIFIQNGCAAIAVSSRWFTENIDSQAITHTPKDNIEIVDSKKLLTIAQSLNNIVRRL